jgi:hypothetical protein
MLARSGDFGVRLAGRFVVTVARGERKTSHGIPVALKTSLLERGLNPATVVQLVRSARVAGQEAYRDIRRISRRAALARLQFVPGTLKAHFAPDEEFQYLRAQISADRVDSDSAAAPSGMGAEREIMARIRGGVLLVVAPMLGGRPRLRSLTNTSRP